MGPDFDEFVDNWINGNRSDCKVTLESMNQLDVAKWVLRFSEHMRSLGAGHFPHEVSSFRNWLDAIS